MAHLEELVHEISFTVNRMSTRINEEQEKIKKFTERQESISRQNNEIRQINDQLRADIERLEETIYRESQQTEQLTVANELVQQRVQTLTKALEEIEQVNEKMRNEKTSLLEEYHSRLNNFENGLQRNAILRDFVEKWRYQVKRNKDLLVFPEVIKNLANSLETFYASNIADRLESLVPNPSAQGDTVTDSSIAVSKNTTEQESVTKETEVETLATEPEIMADMY
nr:conserved hypothetical protein [Hymenolepis microstoma]